MIVGESKKGFFVVRKLNLVGRLSCGRRVGASPGGPPARRKTKKELLLAPFGVFGVFDYIHRRTLEGVA